MLVLSSRRGGMRIGAGDSAMRARFFHLVLGLAAALSCAHRPAQAQHPIPEAERWATITHPGNEAFTFDPPGPGPLRSLARVDYEYQISRTEVTGAEWFEFVQAYAPYVSEDAWGSDQFISRQIATTGYRQYALPAGNVNRAVEVGWTFATRYANWLHNGKALTADAFQSGVYDIAEFDDPTPDPTLVRSPDARFWIPSEDEWLKAAHFDPNRHGPGMPGYWLYSHTSDSPPFPPAPPSEGGQTSTGGFGIFSRPDVAAYTGIQSPWGLWDTSGGFSEWVSSREFAEITAYGAAKRGSSWRDPYQISIDLGLDRIEGRFGFGSVVGLRLARAVPGPTGGGVFACALSLIARRRRQIDDTHESYRDRVGVLRVRASRP